MDYAGGSEAVGVFGVKAMVQPHFSGTHVSNSTSNWGTFFDAGRSNSVYSGTAVTPLSLTCRHFIKY